MSGELLRIVWDSTAERAVRLQLATELLDGLSEKARQAEFAYQASSPFSNQRESRCQPPLSGPAACRRSAVPHLFTATPPIPGPDSHH